MGRYAIAICMPRVTVAQAKRLRKLIDKAVNRAINARRRSRDAVGTVPGGRRIEDKRRKAPKHKKAEY